MENIDQLKADVEQLKKDVQDLKTQFADVQKSDGSAPAEGKEQIAAEDVAKDPTGGASAGAAEGTGAVGGGTYPAAGSAPQGPVAQKEMPEEAQKPAEPQQQ